MFVRAKSRAALDLSDTDSTSSLLFVHVRGSSSDTKVSSNVGSTPCIPCRSASPASHAGPFRDKTAAPLQAEMHASLDSPRAAGGRQTNHTAVKRWFRYCEDVAPAHGLGPPCPLPASVETVLGFIRHLQHEDKVSSDTLSCYLAVINKLHQDRGFERPALGARIRTAKKSFAAARLNNFKDSSRLDSPKDGGSGSLLKGDSSLSRDSHEYTDVAGREEMISGECEKLWAAALEKTRTPFIPHVRRWIQYCQVVVPSLGRPALSPVPATPAGLREFLALLEQEDEAQHASDYMTAINLLHVDLGYPMPAVFVGAVMPWNARQEEDLLSPQPSAASKSSVPLSPLVLASASAPAAPPGGVAVPSPAPAAAPTAPGLDDTSMCSANNEEDGRTSPCLESWAAQMSGASPAPLTPIPPPLVLPGL